MFFLDPPIAETIVRYYTRETAHMIYNPFHVYRILTARSEQGMVSNREYMTMYLQMCDLYKREPFTRIDNSAKLFEIIEGYVRDSGQLG